MVAGNTKASKVESEIVFKSYLEIINYQIKNILKPLSFLPEPSFPSLF